MALAYQDHYTVEDYRRWEGQWELIDGMPYAMTPSPSVTHQIVSANLLSQIKQILEKAAKSCAQCYVLMETDWEVSSDTVVRPDILITCDDLDERVIRAPGFIVEVVSTSSSKRDEQQKFDLYRKEGVGYYVLVYPKKRLAKIYRNDTRAFTKKCDTSDDSVDFKLGECRFSVDFGRIWR